MKYSDADFFCKGGMILENDVKVQNNIYTFTPNERIHERMFFTWYPEYFLTKEEL